MPTATDRGTKYWKRIEAEHSFMRSVLQDIERGDMPAPRILAGKALDFLRISAEKGTAKVSD